MKSLVHLLVAGVALMGGVAHAQSSVQIGAAGFGGTGCPGGAATAALGADGILTLEFGTISVAAGATAGATSDRKACDVAIPVTVPTGMSVALTNLHYQGETNLPAGANAEVSVELFAAGQTGPVTKQTIAGPADGAFTSEPAAEMPTWSPCGGDPNLRIHLAILVNTAENAAASASLTSPATVKVETKACT